jgi:hypothetical protein
MPDMWRSFHFSQQGPSKAMDIQDTVFSISPICILSEGADVDIPESWFKRQPILKPG